MTSKEIKGNFQGPKINYSKLPVFLGTSFFFSLSLYRTGLHCIDTWKQEIKFGEQERQGIETPYNKGNFTMMTWKNNFIYWPRKATGRLAYLDLGSELRRNYLLKFEVNMLGLDYTQCKIPENIKQDIRRKYCFVWRVSLGVILFWGVSGRNRIKTSLERLNANRTAKNSYRKKPCWIQAQNLNHKLLEQGHRAQSTKFSSAQLTSCPLHWL